MCANVSPFQRFNHLTDFNDIWYQRHDVRRDPFQFPITADNNMADAWNFEGGDDDTSFT
jgi:hypothetical protein